MIPFRSIALLALAYALVAPAAQAVESIYIIEPTHTYPSFEADHMGMSSWRGKFNLSHGQIRLDREAGAGQVDIRVDLRSIDFGLDAMNQWAVGNQFFDTEKFPEATYHGKLIGFRDGAPTQVEGEFTLHGITRPLTLIIDRFKCQPHPLHKRDWCGADAHATFNRSEFGLDAGKDYGFDMNVTLRIQVEADIKTDEAPAKP